MTDRMQPCATVERRTEVRAVPRTRDRRGCPSARPARRRLSIDLRRESWMESAAVTASAAPVVAVKQASDESPAAVSTLPPNSASRREGWRRLRECWVHRVRRSLPSTGRALHVSEEKGDRLCRRRRWRHRELRRSGWDRTRRLRARRALRREPRSVARASPAQGSGRDRAVLGGRLQPLERTQRVWPAGRPGTGQHELPPEALA